LPVQSVKDLIALAKSQPGKIAFGTSSTAGPTHLLAGLFSTEAGIKTLHVPYKGGGPAVVALMGGHIQFFFSTPVNVATQIRNGSLRPLAVTGKSRLPAFPDVPTFAEEGLPADSFVFCCFNNSYKITPDVFDIWMRLLLKVSGSVLWLLDASQGVADRLRAEARSRGVAPERLIFAPRMEQAEHLARHRLADLFLDTLPYNAHTTASDALWTGLPLVTCLGTTFAGRVGASLLRAVGMPELVTRTLPEYEALALRLATNRSELKAVREKLARNRLTQPLFDTARFTRNIEAAYRRMWEAHQRGEAPRSFEV